jgi:hypothetical protein
MTGRRASQALAGRQVRPDDGPDSVGVYSPSRHDSVARAASTVIGGPAGRRLATSTGFWRAIPILMLLACVVLSAGLVQKEHCRAQGWTSPDQFWHACYSDIPVLYGSASLGANPHPTLGHTLGPGGLQQPPLAGAMMWLTSAFIPTSGPTGVREYFDLSSVLLAFLLAIGVAAVALISGRRAWDAAHLALSPVLITAGLISYELLGVTLTAVALLALARGRPILGGVLFGLAVASAPQLAVLAVVVAILTSRYLRNAAGSAFAGTALVTWFVLRVLLLPGLTGGLGPAFRSWRQASPGYGSLWLVPQLLGASHPQTATSVGGRVLQGLFGWLFDAGALDGTTSSILALMLFAVLTAGVLACTVVADPPADPRDWIDPEPGQPHLESDLAPGSELVPVQAEAPVEIPGGFVTSRVAPLGLALLAVVLVTAKTLPVQTSLLLLPLIALSGLRWRDHLIWAATEVVYFLGIWLYIAGETTPNRGLPATFYLILVLARLAGIAWVGLQGVLIFRAAGSAESSELGREGSPLAQLAPTT